MATTTRPVLIVSAIVFLANAGLLVLQLVAGRLLVPFIGSSLETWTAIIGFFLLGIALGNAVGGRLADRANSRHTLALALLAGSVTSLGMIGWPALLNATGWHQLLVLQPRIFVLSFVECFPTGFVLSLLTPTAIKLGLPNREAAGRAAGRVFALGTLGCLIGNYLAGFGLIPGLTINAIVYSTAGVFAVLALLAGLLPTRELMAPPSPIATPAAPVGKIILPMPSAIAIVFVCSFCGMAIELTATRMLAQIVGVSLYTWTGVIGVMLAGTACGNWLGGRIASSPARLAWCMLLAIVAGLHVLTIFFAGSQAGWFENWPMVTRILAWTFSIFFPLMLMLGTISPQVIRLSVHDVAHVGRTAGRIYAWSTAGAIVGTFATGIVLLSTVGMYRLVLGSGVLIALVLILTLREQLTRPLFCTLSTALGLTIGGFLVLTPAKTQITAETNYFTLRVLVDPVNPKLLRLQQDLLVHSVVDPENPTFLYYPHEKVQLQFLAQIATYNPKPAVLVIGGGGYTFPRAAKTHLPTCTMDVVEIDPGVTRISYSHLGLNPALGIRSFHQDGRQFVTEQAKGEHYDLITLDAVNDLSVPAHLLTMEFNAAVKQTLKPKGIYLVTLIDTPETGHLWKASFHTLRQTFTHVEVLMGEPLLKPLERTLMILYASDVPLATTPPLLPDGQPGYSVHTMTEIDRERFLASERSILLSDQYAPVDNLMAEVFRASKATQER